MVKMIKKGLGNKATFAIMSLKLFISSLLSRVNNRRVIPLLLLTLAIMNHGMMQYVIYVCLLCKG